MTDQHPSQPPQTPPAKDRRRRSGLGRGLGALIPEITTPEIEASVSEVDIASVQPNPYQPRSEFEDEAFQELVASISLHGVLQPIIVSPDPTSGKLVLIAGERRWRAAEAAGLDRIPALIKDATPQQMLELALVENVVRADLSPLEEAIAYRQLIDEFGLTQSEVAERVGRSRVSVTNTLRLLFAPDAVKLALQRGDISEGHARALLSLPSPADQVSMLESLLAREMTVRQTEAAVRSWLNRPTRQTERSASRLSAGPAAEQAGERLQRSLSAKVTVKSTASGKGTINVHFDSIEQLEDLVARIAGEPLF
jgi:ParB family chromosome partitioning protein